MTSRQPCRALAWAPYREVSDMPPHGAPLFGHGSFGDPAENPHGPSIPEPPTLSVAHHGPTGAGGSSLHVREDPRGMRTGRDPCALRPVLQSVSRTPPEIAGEEPSTEPGRSAGTRPRRHLPHIPRVSRRLAVLATLSRPQDPRSCSTRSLILDSFGPFRFKITDQGTFGRHATVPVPRTPVKP